MSIAEETKKLHGVPVDATVQNLPMSEIFADEKFNCRGKIIPIDVVELAQNIRETGLIQPIIVQRFTGGPPGTKYRVVAGYRRHKAHEVNRADTIKAIILEGLSDVEAKVINLSENLNREALNLLQEAKAVYELVKQGLTQAEIAEKVQMSRGWVQIRIYTLRLPKPIQEDIEAGWIKSEHIHALQNLPEEEQYAIVKKIKDAKDGDVTKRARVAISKAKVKKDPKKAAKRDHTQIEKMNDHILDAIGSSFATRCLAWAAGNISTNELYEDIEKEAEYLGKTYFIPKEDVSC